MFAREDKSIFDGFWNKIRLQRLIWRLACWSIWITTPRLRDEYLYYKKRAWDNKLVAVEFSEWLGERIFPSGTKDARISELEAELAAAEADAADFHRLWLAGGKQRYELEAQLAQVKAEWDVARDLIERLAGGGTTYGRDGLSPLCSHCGGTGDTDSANSVNHHPHCPLPEARKWTQPPRAPLIFAILAEARP